MKSITLITGGVRSGKSSLALRLARAATAPRTFIATGVAFDAEMAERIRRHQQEREGFGLIEEPLDLAGALAKVPAGTGTVLVDCLTVWAGNLLHAGHAGPEHPLVKNFISALNTIPGNIFIVTNEVGWGIMPENVLARQYQDLLGRINQQTAEAAHRVVLAVSGIPLIIKGESI
jgi:adenosylcobinamide kinase/adenosylcobinamide-phosphate guanylyltransferase